MVPTPPDVTEAELAVLQVLWEMGLATIREIRAELYPDGGTSEYATVQKLLERLESKNFVTRSRRNIPHTFKAKIDRAALVGRRIDELTATLCDGSMAPILSHLVRKKRVSKRDREALRRLIDELDGGVK